jgi:hypothetical protein
MSLEVFKSSETSPTPVTFVLIPSGIGHELDSIMVFGWSRFLEIGYPKLRTPFFLLIQWVTPNFDF